MEVCKTDMKQIVRMLSDAAVFYGVHAKRTKELDRSRKLRKMSNKLKKRYA